MQLDIRLTSARGIPGALALPVFSSEEGQSRPFEGQFSDEVTEYIDDFGHAGVPGEVASLPRPGRKPRWIFLVGVGEGDPDGWRVFGATVTRSAAKETSVTIEVPSDTSGDRLRALVEGLRLAAYRYRQAPLPSGQAPKLRRVNLVGPTDTAALDAAIVVAESTLLARDWVNTDSARKSPQWLAAQMERAADGITGVKVKVWGPRELTSEGFGGILAVGSGSARPPRLVEMSWAPRRAKRHVVLVGKGITFDTGGISIKPAAGMILMRKDMGGAAAVAAALLGVARLKLPIAVTVLAPMAENAVGASSFRPGDIVRHYGGMTSEILNTDAEGRLVLADALAYAVRRLRPDVLIDLATLTGAQNVALGKRTAALFTENDTLAAELTESGAQVGERMWRMPLTEDYVEELHSGLADLINSTEIGAGSGLAALYLREFAGEARSNWAHLDMSSVSWSDGVDKELSRGATGWGVRTLIRFLEEQSQHD